tara:strand:- start:758 stop:898 length:141 start_codon:yes stop_codon:yes gene_type:complete
MKYGHYIIGTTLILCMGMMLWGVIDKIGRGRDIEQPIVISGAYIPY